MNHFLPTQIGSCISILMDAILSHSAAQTTMFGILIDWLLPLAYLGSINQDSVLLVLLPECSSYPSQPLDPFATALATSFLQEICNRFLTDLSSKVFQRRKGHWHFKKSCAFMYNGSSILWLLASIACVHDMSVPSGCKDNLSSHR